MFNILLAFAGCRLRMEQALASLHLTWCSAHTRVVGRTILIRFGRESGHDPRGGADLVDPPGAGSSL